MSPMQRMALIVALVGGGFIGYWGFNQIYQSRQPAPITATPVKVARTTIRQTVASTGTVTATQQTNLSFQQSGQIVSIPVKVGDSVTAGQALATLDTTQLTIARDTAQSNLASARAKLQSLLGVNTPDIVAAAQQGVASSQSALTTAQNNITSSSANIQSQQAAATKAQNDLAALLAGPTPQQIEGSQSGVDKASSDLAIAQANYDNLVNHSNLATRPEVTALATAKQNYATALANYQAKLSPPPATDLATAQTNLQIAQTSLQAEQLRNLQVQADPTTTYADRAASQGQLDAAEAAIANQQANLQKLQQGTDQADIAAAKAQLDNANAALNAAQTNYNNLLSLSTLSTQPEYSALQTAKSELESAQATFDTTVAPPKDTDVSSGQAAIQGAEASVTSAQAALGNAQASVPSAQASLQASQAKLSQVIAGPLPSDVQQAQEAITSSQLALELAQTNLDNATLKAPFAGVITAVPVSLGQLVSSSTQVATLVNPTAIEIDATVDETSITQLKAGQQATVSFDAIPGKTFPGTLTVVTPSGTTQNGVVVFPIVVDINTQGLTVPAGISANVTIITQTTPNVLAVPSRDVHRVGATQVVDTLVNGKRVPVVVTTGVTNGQQTEIKTGLKEGDLVLPPAVNAAGGAGSTFGAGGIGGGGPQRPASP